MAWDRAGAAAGAGAATNVGAVAGSPSAAKPGQRWSCATIGAGSPAPHPLTAIPAAAPLPHIQPGNPQQNAYIERFNRTVRYDWLGHYLFESLNELQEFATNWLWVYNHERPNMALGGYTPKQRLAQAA